MQKVILVDAVMGAGFPSMDFADEMTKRGLARFTGNQWNEEWRWNRDSLEKLSDIGLLTLYNRIKNYKDEPVTPSNIKFLTSEETINNIHKLAENIFKK